MQLEYQYQKLAEMLACHVASFLKTKCKYVSLSCLFGVLKTHCLHCFFPSCSIHIPSHTLSARAIEGHLNPPVHRK